MTFTGIDLGVDSGEIEIMFGDVECLIEDRSYVLGNKQWYGGEGGRGIEPAPT